MVIEEDQGIEGVVLGGGSDVVVDGQVFQQGPHFRRAHFPRMAFLVEEGAERDPLDRIRLTW